MAILSAVLAPGARAAEPAADLVLRGGIVHTLDARRPRAQAIAIQGTKVLATGSDAEIAAFIDEHTRVVALAGRTVVPGFEDAHAHLLEIGYAKLDLDLSDATSYADVVARVATAARGRRPGEWIRGRGWHEGKWHEATLDAVRGFPTHAALSAVTPHNPVALERADGHALLANARAMALRGITRRSAVPDGGEMIVDASGEPTGVFVDHAQSLVAAPARRPDEEERALELATDACLANGVTSLTDAGASLEVIRLYRRAAEAGRLRIHLAVMAAGLETMRALDRPQSDLGGGFLSVRAVKLYADGALGSRGAALLAPYSDDPGNRGLLLMAPEAVLETARFALAHGFQLATHAIGDRANRMVLDSYERALAEAPGVRDPRFRIEHAQVLDLADVPRFARLGVLASVQGVHCPSDRSWAPARLGPERLRGAYAWRKLLASGARILNGTDAPVEDLSPIRNFHATVTRQDEHGQPAGGYDPEEKLTREEALRSMTLEPAFGSFAEGSRGSLAPGMRADLVVLSQDILAVADDELLATEIVATIVDGRTRYARPGSGF